MDFELTKLEKQIWTAAREFAEGEFSEIAQKCDAKGDFPKELVKKSAQLGFVGCFVKNNYGGLGLGFVEHAIILGGVLEG